MSELYKVRVAYTANEVSEEVDERITAAADRQPDFSGCGLWEGANRDLGWYCKSLAEAEQLKRRLDDHYEGWPPLTTRIQEPSP